MAAPGRGGFGDPFDYGSGFGDSGEDPGFGDPYLDAAAEDFRGDPHVGLNPENIVHATADDYRDAWLLLLPPGPLWDWDIDPALFDFAGGVTAEPARASDQIEKINTECNPCLTDEMLPEWEEVFGLPDDCAPPTADEDARKAAVRAVFLAQGGQTNAYFLSVLLQVFGVTGTIDEAIYTPFTTSDGSGHAPPPWSGSVVGDPLYSYSGWFHWRLNIPGSQVANQAMADRIECVFNRIKPSHTRVIFNYV